MYDSTKYKWELKRVPPQELEKTLDNLPEGWEVFTILTYGDGFVVIVRRP
jgi:hypothetical protein